MKKPRQIGVYYSLRHKRRVEALHRESWIANQWVADSAYWFALAFAVISLMLMRTQ